MPSIFELFGFHIDNRSDAAETCRKARRCPYADGICDGGGNRYQTKITIKEDDPLRQYFNPDVTEVVPGVCSIQAGADVWVVCPRRLLAARYSGAGRPPTNDALQPYEREILIDAGLPKDVEIGLWPEVTLKQKIDDADINYHFDYIAAPICQTTLAEAIKNFSIPTDKQRDELTALVTLAKKNGYFPPQAKNHSEIPISLPDLTTPYILEVMTASTSGSDTKNETDMRNAFRKAILRQSHISPGINKRQVWGRMVTQLFAKTALANQWQGKTAWIIQDELLKNIELTTRLRTSTIPNEPGQNITMIVLHYQPNEDKSHRICLRETVHGKAGLNLIHNDSFVDILLPKVAPPKFELFKAMLRQKVGAIVKL